MNEPKLIRVSKNYSEFVGNKNKEKIKECYFYKNNNFFNLNGFKLILMSDLHSMTEFIVDDLIRKKIINSSTIVITMGDMSGDNKRIGANGDPYNSYKKILANSNKFYFVQGNHDIYDEKFVHLLNGDLTPCMVDSIVVDTPIGKIAGINGIQVDDELVNHNSHKYSSQEYNEKLQKILELNPDIILSHQPILNIDFVSHKTKYYISGHYKIEPFIDIKNNIASINVDNKIIIFE